MNPETSAPLIELKSLDELWFQVSGTVCNLECSHCFISCSPHNHRFEMLSYDKVVETLEESVEWGVREYYFTGGEPFLNKELVPMLEKTLEYGPATIMTNGTVLKPEWLRRLKQAEQRGVYSLEFRVSIDGPNAELNDPIRGERTFERAMKGVQQLVSIGFLPIITMTQVWEESESESVLKEFRKVLADQGYLRPRLKILPRLKIGAEANRTCGYDKFEKVTEEMMADYDEGELICSHSRVMTNRGIAVCPILLEAPDAMLGQNLSEAARPFALSHGACFTCYQYGAICTNPSSSYTQQQKQ